MKPILEIQHISKKFRIRHEKQPYLSIRDSFSSFFKPSNNTTEDFYALQDISFNVNQGDTIGIIGKNGAGKSTLLKILSKITPPTSGKIICRGRIASLLEVGTGFHPELSGRENIFLNGSILGMKRSEIVKNFDAIVDFAGVERFIDTPLKHYSSGMQLRLAFAVAAFLENEIWIIDEVLAVGDSEFQEKCIGKMEDVSKSGRTILFVSHNISAVKQLCKKSILLENGKLTYISDTVSALNKYLNNSKIIDNSFKGKINVNKKIVKTIELKCDNTLSDIFYAGCNFSLDVHFESKVELNFPVLGIIFKDEFDQSILAINNKHYGGNLVRKKITSGTFKMNIPYFPLYNGRYTIDLHFGNSYNDLEVLKNILSFKVEKNGVKGGLEIPDDTYNKIIVEKINWMIIDETNK